MLTIDYTFAWILRRFRSNHFECLIKYKSSMLFTLSNLSKFMHRNGYALNNRIRRNAVPDNREILFPEHKNSFQTKVVSAAQQHNAAPKQRKCRGFRRDKRPLRIRQSAHGVRTIEHSAIHFYQRIGTLEVFRIP